MHGEFPMDPTMLGLVADGEVIVRDDEIGGFEDADGNRIMVPTSTDQEVVEIVGGQLPICPGCSDDHHVYCMECGEPYLACSCVADVEDFWCLACSNEFAWVYTEDDLDSMLDDLDGSWEEAHMVTASEDEEELECTCNPVKSYACAPCGVTRDSLDDDWRPFGVMGDPSQLKKSNGKPACTCEPEASFYCAKCEVKRPTPDHEWMDLSGDQKKQVEDAKAKSAIKTSSTKPGKKICTCTPKPQYYCSVCKVNNNSGSTSYSAGGSYGYTYSKCRHYCETLTLPNGVKVNASSMNNTRNDKEPAPDFGLYCDWGWHPYWRNEHIAWPDYGVPSDYFYAAIQIEEAYNRAKNGETVEVGCIGGHGRTGTALACMVLIADPTMTAVEARDYVRKNYCTETIESDKQEWWIDWFRCYINALELPEPPVFKSKVTTTTTTTKSTTTHTPKGGPHGVQAHYELWTAGKECDDKKCKYWDGDTKRFAKGDVPKSVTETGGNSGTDWNKWKIIDGYRIPKPGVGEPQHAPTARAGCKCDYCRYTERHGAFLESKDSPETVLSAMPDGTIMEISVVKDFKQGPPSAEALTVGVRSGEYIWTVEGWVWEKLVADKDIDVLAAAEARHNALPLDEAADAAAEQAKRLAEAIKVFNGDDDEPSKPEPLRVGAITYDHDSLKMRPAHALHDDGQVGHTACGLLMDGDKTPISTTDVLATTFLRTESKPCRTCSKIVEKRLEDWKEETEREGEILSPVQQLRAMANEEVTALFDDNAADDPTIMPEIDTASKQPEKDLTQQQMDLMRLGLARLNYGSDDPSVTQMAEIRWVLWGDDFDCWTWDEVMGAATINPDEDVESSYPPLPDIDINEQEPESIVSIETLRLVTLGLVKLLGTSPSTIEIRKVLRESTQDEWEALMQLAFRQANGDENFCLECGTWADHFTTQHTSFVNDPEPHEQEDLALLAEEQDDVDRVTWGKKLHQIVKGGSKRPAKAL